MIVRVHSFLFIILFAPLLIAGCAQNPQPLGRAVPDLRYDHLEPYTVRGGAVQIRQGYRLNDQTKAAFQDFQKSPDMVLMDYAYQRFLTQGRPVAMVFNIEKLSMRKLSDKENIIGFLSGAAADSYILDLFISLSPVKGDGTLSDPYTIKLQRRLDIPSQSSLAEREFRQFEFIEKIIHDLDRAITTIVTEKLW